MPSHLSALRVWRSCYLNSAELSQYNGQELYINTDPGAGDDTSVLQGTDGADVATFSTSFSVSGTDASGETAPGTDASAWDVEEAQ